MSFPLLCGKMELNLYRKSKGLKFLIVSKINKKSREIRCEKEDSCERYGFLGICRMTWFLGNLATATLIIELKSEEDCRRSLKGKNAIFWSMINESCSMDYKWYTEFRAFPMNRNEAVRIRGIDGWFLDTQVTVRDSRSFVILYTFLPLKDTLNSLTWLSKLEINFRKGVNRRENSIFFDGIINKQKTATTALI